MCSIAGMIDFARDVRGLDLTAMRNCMTSRGPDQRGQYRDKAAALFHNRLCVIDAENGRQPMSIRRDGRQYILVYNGELYNTSELRAELSSRGCTFAGHSDTEVLLNAYIEWGGACVERLNGIFAFAVWEPQEQRLFLARDRMGVKPLFYTLRNGALIFASEIKGLLAHPWVEPEADRDSVLELLLTGPGRTPGCGVFRDIQELPPAYCGYFAPDGLHLTRYWKLTPRPHTDSEADTIAHVRWLVTDAIERQLVSDVPLGTFLSGGLDSGIISSVANRRMAERGQRLMTFSVDYTDNRKYFKAGKFQPNTDTDYIPGLRDWLGCGNVLVTVGMEELADALYDAVDARDLPGMADVDSSLLVFCRKIKEYVTVALSGECADEIFGGYPWYRDETIRTAEGFPWAQSTTWRSTFLQPDYLRGVDPREYVMERYRRTVADTECLENDSPVDRRMREMMRLNTDWFMQTLLDRKDRMSMFSALEVRVPFCDHRIAEYLYNVPWELKDVRLRE
ncbi:MAG: asparagine synthase (glutamine-hydrolyzing) [Oscillospiraceae bacterium]